MPQVQQVMPRALRVKIVAPALESALLPALVRLPIATPIVSRSKWAS
jgi:hypothetical protein